MAARVVLVLMCVTVIGWTGVLLRNFQVGDGPALRAFFGPPPATAAERDRIDADLATASTLDPSSYWELARTSLYLRTGDPARAQRGAEELVRTEPENPFAWSALRSAATAAGDSRRAKEADARFRQLNPLASRGRPAPR